MRELDLLLQMFLASGLGSLEDEELDGLENLLMQPDQDILAWLTSAVEPQDAELRGIVNVVRSRIQSQSNAHEPDESHE